MPLTQINAVGDRPDDAGLARIADAAAALPRGAPIFVMSHGYKYSPFEAAHDPHRKILSFTPCPSMRRPISWPSAMGFGAGDPAAGLCVAFGWHARGTLWQASREAFAAGRALSQVVAVLHRHGRRPVQIVAHSLGARVALGAIAGAERGAVGRAVLIAGAALRSEAQAALNSPAGRAAEILNVISAENDFYDLMFERLVAPFRVGDPSLGAGLAGTERWLDMQVDHPKTRRALVEMGFDVAPGRRRICHWSAYLRPGLLEFYANALRHPQRMPLNILRTWVTVPAIPRPVRLLGVPDVIATPLPLRRNASP